MHEINWAACHRVADNPVARAFLTQLAAERKRPNTLLNYGYDLNDFLEACEAMSFLDILEADEQQIARYVDWLYDRKAKRGSGHKRDRDAIVYLTGAHLAPATIRRRVNTVRQFYAWCIRMRHRRDQINPVRRGERGKCTGLVNASQMVPWIPDDCQWATILAYVLDHFSLRDQLIVLLAYDGALRREEIILLRYDQIDWRYHQIAIPHALTKTGLPGTVVLSHTTYTRLKAYCAGDRASLLAHHGADPAGPILLSESARNPGQPLTKWTVKDVFDRLRAAVGIPQLTPHKMRHLLLTHLHRSGEMDLLDIARYGRHKSLASTQVYVHTDTSDLTRKLTKVHAQREAIIRRLHNGEGARHGEP